MKTRHRSIDATAMKRAINVLDFYRVELPTMKTPNRAAKWIDGSLCPFHPDTKAGSFKINADTGAYRCFSCGAHGSDIFAFTMQRHNLDFPNAVRAIADAHGICSTEKERPRCSHGAKQNRARW